MMSPWLELLAALPAPAAVVLKATAWLSLGWALHLALARCNPRWRVLVWRAMAIGLLALPAGEVLLPRLEVPVLPAAQAGAVHSPDVFPTRDAGVDSWMAQHAWHALAAVWAGVAVLLLVRVSSAAHRVRRELREASPAPAGVCRMCATLCESLGVRRGPRVLVAQPYASPFLAGLLNPAIVLPKRMLTPEYKRELPAVLGHELAHLQSRDPFWLLVTALLSRVLWFHPLAWALPRAHAAACERVCDAMAAERAGGPSAYAGSLARIALAFAAGDAVAGGVPMVRPAEIVRRLRALEWGIRAQALGRPKVALTLGMAVATVGLLAVGQLTRAERTKEILKATDLALLSEPESHEAAVPFSQAVRESEPWPSGLLHLPTWEELSTQASEARPATAPDESAPRKKPGDLSLDARMVKPRRRGAFEPHVVTGSAWIEADAPDVEEDEEPARPVDEFLPVPQPPIFNLRSNFTLTPLGSSDAATLPSPTPAGVVDAGGVKGFFHAAADRVRRAVTLETGEGVELRLRFSMNSKQVPGVDGPERGS